MMQEKISLSSGNGSSGEGSIEVSEFSKSHRVSRALVRGTIGVVVSAALLVVPLLHLILTPLGLIITFLLVSSALATKKIIEQGEGECPACHGKVRIFRRPYRLPFREICDSCRREVLISLQQ